MIHELKILPEHFQPVADGLKLPEVRKNDRGFSVGDYLILKEWTDEGGYSGRIVVRKIIHISDIGSYLPSYVLLSMEKLDD